MSQIVKSGFAERKGKGIYLIKPYKIEEFLDSLDHSEDSRPQKNNLKAKGKMRIRKGITKKIGVGKDILELVEQNFFDTPKTVKEIEEKLKEEVKFHDTRVIDRTIRETFVKSKKLLKRIKNTGEGKARWLYVIRK